MDLDPSRTATPAGVRVWKELQALSFFCAADGGEGVQWTAARERPRGGASREALANNFAAPAGQSVRARLAGAPALCRSCPSRMADAVRGAACLCVDLDRVEVRAAPGGDWQPHGDSLLRLVRGGAGVDKRARSSPLDAWAETRMPFDYVVGQCRADAPAAPPAN